MVPQRLTIYVLTGAALVVLFQDNALHDISLIFPFSAVLFGYYFLKLFLNFGKKLIVIDALEVLCVTFMLFTPALFEHLGQEYLATMQISFPMSENYFVLAIPSVLAILASLSLPLLNRFEHEKTVLSVSEDVNFQKLGILLFVGGVAFTFINNLFPLGFISEFFSGLAKVGVLYLLFSGHRGRYVILYSYLGLMLIEALGRGMIGEFFWWISLIGMFYLMLHPFSLAKKLAYASLFFICIGILQSIKGEYRMAVWNDRGELAGMSSVDVYRHLFTERLSFEQIFAAEETLNSLSRLNQGYLTSMAIEYTPANEPFAKGETIAAAIASSLVPRVLWPNKPQAGGAAKMQRFAGVDIQGSGMNIGILGEAYVNFGFAGAAVLMFFYGLLLNFVYSKFLMIGQSNPYILLWIPLAFFGLMSVETDFVTTLNHLIKFLVFFYFLNKILTQVTSMKLW
jgi:hypothetical protein